MAHMAWYFKKIPGPIELWSVELRGLPIPAGPAGFKRGDVLLGPERPLGFEPRGP